jgi:hypothetical protein
MLATLISQFFFNGYGHFSFSGLGGQFKIFGDPTL